MASYYFSSMAVLPDQPGFSESLSFLLQGFWIVMLALTILALTTHVIGRLFVVLSKSEKVDKPVQLSSEPQIEEIDERVLAAIAAAVYTVCGNHVQMTRVKQVGTEQRWSQEGRHSLLSSHNPRNPSGRSQSPFGRKDQP